MTQITVTTILAGVVGILIGYVWGRKTTERDYAEYLSPAEVLEGCLCPD